MSRKKLDENQPFGTVAGKTEDNTRYIQDGVRFGPDKFEILSGEVGNAPVVEVEPEVVSVPETTTKSASSLKPGELRELVERSGGTYKNKEQAIKFLENLSSE